MRSLLVIIIFSTQIAIAQHPGVRYKQDEMITYYQEILKYGLRNGDTLVDIGSGDGKHTFTIFKFYPDSYFMMIDLDERFGHTYAANVSVNGKTKWFKNYRSFFVGTDSTIPLSSSKYKLVLCRQTFHEFSKPSQMLAEMRRILSDDGVLIIEEAIPEFEGQSDPNCKHKYWKKEELVEVFEANGFKLIWSDVTMYDVKKAKVNLNILKFKKG